MLEVLVEGNEAAVLTVHDLAVAKNNDNPVYYIQYAHARVCSVLRQADEKQLPWDVEQGLASLDRLVTSHETDLMNLLARYPETVAAAARELAPHIIAQYLRELAAGLHTWYNAEQFLVEDAALRNARLESFQSNAEHELVERVQALAVDPVDFAIVNPGAFTHTSIALRDALLAVSVPFIEVHLSNVHAREPFRRHSYFSDIAAGSIVGLGAQGYELALAAALDRLDRPSGGD